MAFNKGEKSFFEQEKELQEKQGSGISGKVFRISRRKEAEALRTEKSRNVHPFLLFGGTFLLTALLTGTVLFNFSEDIPLQVLPQKKDETSKTPAVAGKSQKNDTEKYDHQLLASKLTKGEKDIVIVDIRGEAAYDDGHIVTSLNIPVEGTRLITDTGELDGELLAEAFEEVKSEKTVVVYGQNAYETIPEEIAAQLSKEGWKIMPLAVGWEEWEHLHSK